MKTEKKRCGWCEGNSLYQSYHDEEWGVPVYDEQKLFEFLVLETFQSGLSWITILKKRDNFRQLFDQFNFDIISTYDKSKIDQLLSNQRIVRNRLKILATINNAKCFIELLKNEESFSKFIWNYVNQQPLQNNFEHLKKIPSKTKLAEQISVVLKKRGFKLIGPTTIYAFMQAIGIVNDHLVTCFRHKELL
jgi:DNA-3-methyladenine glycosylase I